MANDDNEAQNNNKKKGEDGKKKSSFCFDFFFGFLLLIYYVFYAVMRFFGKIGDAISYIWYPFKERILQCCSCCRKRYRPC